MFRSVAQQWKWSLVLWWDLIPVARHCQVYHHLQSQELQQQSITDVKSEIRCWVIKHLREQKDPLKGPRASSDLQCEKCSMSKRATWTRLMVWDVSMTMKLWKAIISIVIRLPRLRKPVWTTSLSLSKSCLGFWHKGNPARNSDFFLPLPWGCS